MKFNEKELKSAIIRSTNAIKKKYRDLHQQRLAHNQEFRLKYEPIIDPIIKLNENKNRSFGDASTKKSDETITEQSDSGNPQYNTCTPKPAEKLLTRKSCRLKKRRDVEIPSFRALQPRRLIFDEAIEGDKESADDFHFKRPVIQSDDRILNSIVNDKVGKERVVLRDIVLTNDIEKLTSAEKKQDKPRISKKGKKGDGIQTDYMIVNKSNKAAELTYWDDPNELVERLQLLISSQSAGHNAHNNEIISIIDELREANLIH